VLGKTELYRIDDDIRDFCGMLDGLAFLLEDKVQDGMLYLREHTPDGMIRPNQGNTLLAFILNLQYDIEICISVSANISYVYF